MRDQITSISKAAFMSIRNIGRIRQYLTRHVTKLITHAFVTSRLDYGNVTPFTVYLSNNSPVYSVCRILQQEW